MPTLLVTEQAELGELDEIRKRIRANTDTQQEQVVEQNKASDDEMDINKRPTHELSTRDRLGLPNNTQQQQQRDNNTTRMNR